MHPLRIFDNIRPKFDFDEIQQAASHIDGTVTSAFDLSFFSFETAKLFLPKFTTLESISPQNTSEERHVVNQQPITLQLNAIGRAKQDSHSMGGSPPLVCVALTWQWTRQILSFRSAPRIG
jgi:hypothetical protein